METLDSKPDLSVVSVFSKPMPQMSAGRTARIAVIGQQLELLIQSLTNSSTV